MFTGTCVLAIEEGISFHPKAASLQYIRYRNPSSSWWRDQISPMVDPEIGVLPTKNHTASGEESRMLSAKRERWTVFETRKRDFSITTSSLFAASTTQGIQSGLFRLRRRERFCRCSRGNFFLKSPETLIFYVLQECRTFLISSSLRSHWIEGRPRAARVRSRIPRNKVPGGNHVPTSGGRRISFVSGFVKVSRNSWMKVESGS